MNEKLKDLLSGIIIIGVYTMAQFYLQKIPIIIHFTLLFGILFHGQLLGKHLFPKAKWSTSFVMGTIMFFALFSIFMTLGFYLGKPLSLANQAWSSIVAMIVCEVLAIIIPTNQQAENENEVKENHGKAFFFGLLLGLCSITSVGYVIFSAFKAATTDSIRTPWPLLPAGTLAAIALSWLAVALTIKLVKWRPLIALQTGLSLLATTSITTLIYKLGYGFDGFLHIATEKIILASGTLTPKPLYYIGQYVFTTWISKTLDLPIESVDRFLVPIATALLLPLVLMFIDSAQDLGPDGKPQYSSYFFLLLLPLGAFIATTPQSFSYLLGFCALILASNLCSKSVNPIAPIILSLWSCAVHPLAGVPILLITLALSLTSEYFENYKIFRLILAWPLAILSALAVPMLFYFLSRQGQTDINWNFSGLFSLELWKNFLSSLSPWLGNKYVLWSAWATLVSKSLPIILLAAAVISIKQKATGTRQSLILLTTSSILLIISSVVLKNTGDFAFLIDYERGNYGDRLLLLGQLCLIPAALPFFNYLFQNVWRKQPIIGASFIMFCLAIAAAQSYNALPRHDALTTGRGWSVSQADNEAVRWIERDANATNYTVLANQSVSAAAVSQLGFKRYAGDVFFYPIPTGGPLYDLFLRLTYRETTPETILDAARLGDTKLVYVVLNDYWWNAETVGEKLSNMAHQEWTFGKIDQGTGKSVRVYKFDLNKPIKLKTEVSGS